MPPGEPGLVRWSRAAVRLGPPGRPDGLPVGLTPARPVGLITFPAGLGALQGGVTFC